MGKNTVHLNIVPHFVPLKQLEIGLCMAEVYDPELIPGWDEIMVGGDLKTELSKVVNVCRKCVSAIPADQSGASYVIAFRRNKTSKEIFTYA